MNFKLSLILGGILLASLGSFKLYYDKSEAEKEAMATQLQQSLDNQLLLENSIVKQNEAITAHLKKEAENKVRISELSVANNAAQEEVNRLKNTFAKHNLNMLSMSKPGLIERIVNKATVRVGKELETLTDPNQFNEDTTDTNSNSTS
tara:strand:- start:82 stop:525 length:444 start_codon:yes stop_codon:yes gene_type:complete